MFKGHWRKADRALRAHDNRATDQQQPAVKKQEYLDRKCHRIYSCIHCRAHLANHDELISKLFQGNHGRAYLFNKVVNVGCKQAVQRELLTGLHAVADIYCDSCEMTLGWKYERAFVPSQKYKEGKYIIELVHMLKENKWDLASHNAIDLLQEHNGKANLRDDRRRLRSISGRNLANNDAQNKSNNAHVIHLGNKDYANGDTKLSASHSELHNVDLGNNILTVKFDADLIASTSVSATDERCSLSENGCRSSSSGKANQAG